MSFIWISRFRSVDIYVYICIYMILVKYIYMIYIYNFGEGGGTWNQAHILQNAAISLLKFGAADISMNDFGVFLDMRRCKNWAYKIFSWKYLTIQIPILPISPEHRVPHFWSTPWALSGVLRVSSCSGSWFNPCRGRWWVPIPSSQELTGTYS